MGNVHQLRPADHARFNPAFPPALDNLSWLDGEPPALPPSADFDPAVEFEPTAEDVAFLHELTFEHPLESSDLSVCADAWATVIRGQGGASAAFVAAELAELASLARYLEAPTPDLFRDARRRYYAIGRAETHDDGPRDGRSFE